MAQSSDSRSIAGRCREVRQSILNLLDKARTTEVPVEPQKLVDVLDRFKLWTGNLGALHEAHKRLSLESRLVDSPEVQNEICEQLDDIQEAIQDLLTLSVGVGPNTEEQTSPPTIDLPADDLVPDIEYTSREEEANSILEMVTQCLKALFRIGILVRKATSRDRFERALQQSEFAFTAQFDINYTEERYPKLAFKGSKWLAARLGDANAKRRQFINYVRDHKAKLEVEVTSSAADAVTVAQSSKATTFAVPENFSTSKFLDTPFEIEDDSVSLVSASTAFDHDTSLSLPSLADLSPDGEYFECPICFTLQSFRKEKSWKIHAYRDLKAYVCLSGGHECAHKMFGDRDTWFNHELKHHYSLFMCKFCGSQSTDSELLQQHMIDDHGWSSKANLVSVIEQGKLVPSQLKAQDCPFCDDWATILSHRRHQAEGRTSPSIRQADILVSLTHFKRHVATHQEQLAIFAVPRAVDDDEQRSHKTDDPNSYAASSEDRESAATDEGVHVVDESIPIEYSSTWVHLNGLPPGVRKIDIENECWLKQLHGFTVIPPRNRNGFIGFMDPEDARKAVESFNGSTLMGETIKARFAIGSLDSVTVDTELALEPFSDNFDAFRSQFEVDQRKVDTCRVKLYQLGDSDWQDLGTGFCKAAFVEDANGRKEADILVDSEEEPGRMILEERVHEGVNFQKQQDTIIVWTQPQTRTDMALSFQEASGADTIWKIIDAVQRNVDEELGTSDAQSSPAVSSQNASPQTKVMFPDLKKEEPKATPKPAFMCTEPGCEMTNTEFPTDEARKLHYREVHLLPTLRSFDAAFGLDEHGRAKPQSTEETSKGFVNQIMPFTKDYVDSAVLEKELTRILGHNGWTLDTGQSEHHHLNVQVSRLLTETEINSIMCRGRNHHEISLEDSNVDIRSTHTSAASKSLDVTAAQSNRYDQALPSDSADPE